MTLHPRPAARVLVAILASAALLAGCVGPRVLPYANEVETRYLGEPATRALNGILYERYNHVYSDPTGNGYWYWMAYDGCDSVGETAFDPNNPGN